MADEGGAVIETWKGASVVLRRTLGRPNFKPAALERLAGWSADGRSLYLIKVYAPSLRVIRLDATTGSRTTSIEVLPDSVHGVVPAGPAKAVVHTIRQSEEHGRHRYRLINLDEARVIEQLDASVPGIALAVPEPEYSGTWMQTLVPSGSALPTSAQGEYRSTPGTGAVSMDGALFILDADGTHRDRLLLRNADGGVLAIVHAPDGVAIMFATFGPGRSVVVGLEDGSVARWDYETATWRWRTSCHARAVAALQRSADGRTFFSYGRDDRACATDIDGRLRWSVALRRPQAEVLHTRQRTGMIIPSPHGDSIAVDAWSTVRILDAATGAERSVLEGHLDRVARVAFSPDGARVASAGWDGDVRVHRVSSGETEWTLEVSDDEVSSIEFLLDGATLRACGRDGRVTRWNLRNGLEAERWDAGADAHLQSRESRDGSRTLVWSGRRYSLWSDRDARRVVWSHAVADEKVRNEYWPGGGHFGCFAAFSRDPARVLVALKAENDEGRWNWRLETLDAASGAAIEEARPLSGHVLTLQELDHDTVAVLHETEDVVIVSERREAADLRLQGAGASSEPVFRKACVSGDGRWVALGGGNLVEVWRLTKTPGRVGRVRLSEGADSPSALAIAPDGRTLAVGTALGCVLLFEVDLRG